jgi:hypothetical protein
VLGFNPYEAIFFFFFFFFVFFLVGGLLGWVGVRSRVGALAILYISQLSRAIKVLLGYDVPPALLVANILSPLGQSISEK